MADLGGEAAKLFPRALLAPMYTIFEWNSALVKTYQKGPKSFVCFQNFACGAENLPL